MIQNADILMLMFIPPMLILLCVSGAMLIEEYGALEKNTEVTSSQRQDNNGDTVFWTQDQNQVVNVKLKIARFRSWLQSL